MEIIQCIKFFFVIMSEPGYHYGTDPIILKFRQKKKSLHFSGSFEHNFEGNRFIQIVQMLTKTCPTRKPGSLDEEKLSYSSCIAEQNFSSKERALRLRVRLLVLS